MAKAIFNGTVIADSNDTERVEGNAYIPGDSVATEYLRASATPYTCFWKGQARYYDLVVNGTVIRDAGWSYPDPKPAGKSIAGHVAFDQSKGIRVKR